MSIDISNTNSIVESNETNLTEQELNEIKRQEFLENQRQRQYQHMIDVIKRQTTYDEETIKEKLLEFDNDPTKVVKHYLGIDVNKKKEEKKITSVNQGIYSEIRTLMDDAAATYRKKQEYTEYINKVNELRRQQLMNHQLRQSQNLQNKIIDNIPEETNEDIHEEPKEEPKEEINKDVINE